MADIDRLRTVIAALLVDLDVSLYDLEFAGGLLKVTLDRPGGVDLDTLSEANRRISRALDLEDPIPGRYTLEVSSPGLERLLRTPEHFRRAVGERVRIKTRPGAEGARRIEGLLSASDDVSATVITDDGTHVVSLDEIERGRTVFVWGPAPKPGGAKSAAPKSASPKKPPAARRPQPPDTTAIDTTQPTSEVS